MAGPLKGGLSYEKSGLRAGGVLADGLPVRARRGGLGRRLRREDDRVPLNGERERGLLYQRLRNAKIDALELDAPYIAYDDLVLLAQVIHTEAGSAWLPDEWRMAVGEVVLNRVASPEFPDTLEEVVFQPGQYSAADRDWFEVLIPFRPCLEAALRLLGGERVIGDASVVFQSGGLQGGVALELYDSVYGSTYFCYTNHPELYQAA